MLADWPRLCKQLRTKERVKAARTLEWRADAVVVRLSGWSAVAALKRKLTIPYSCVVRVDTKAPAQASLVRLGGTAIGQIRAGHFWHGDGWYFQSYENPEKVVTISLDNFSCGRRRYSKVVTGVEDPKTVQKELEERAGICGQCKADPVPPDVADDAGSWPE